MEPRRMSMRQFEKEFCADILALKPSGIDYYYDLEIPNPNYGARDKDSDEGEYIKCLKSRDGTIIDINYMLECTEEEYRKTYPSDEAWETRKRYFNMYDLKEEAAAASPIFTMLSEESEKRERAVAKAKEALNVDDTAAKKISDATRAIYSAGF